MEFTSQLNNEAKAIRAAAAKKWNCSVKEINWQACVSLACTSQNTMSKEEQLKQSNFVESFGDFVKASNGIDRLYLDLIGKQKSFRGDRSVKIYWDRKTEKLVFQNGKGTRSNGFQDSIDVLDAEFGFDVEK